MFSTIFQYLLPISIMCVDWFRNLDRHHCSCAVCKVRKLLNAYRIYCMKLTRHCSVECYPVVIVFIGPLLRLFLWNCNLLNMYLLCYIVIVISVNIFLLCITFWIGLIDLCVFQKLLSSVLPLYSLHLLIIWIVDIAHCLHYIIIIIIIIIIKE